VASPQLGFDEQDHADLVMDMGPRSLRQRRSASPDRDTEGAVRQFISAVSKALPVVIAMAAAQRKTEAAGHNGRPPTSQCESGSSRQAAGKQTRDPGTERTDEEMAGYEHELLPRR
jgi:hypothetical protein